MAGGGSTFNDIHSLNIFARRPRFHFPIYNLFPCYWEMFHERKIACVLRQNCTIVVESRTSATKTNSAMNTFFHSCEPENTFAQRARVDINPWAISLRCCCLCGCEATLRSLLWCVASSCSLLFQTFVRHSACMRTEECYLAI